MKAIYKYPIEEEVAIPAGAQIIKAGIQRGKLRLWAIVDSDAPTEVRTFDIRGTGWPTDPAFFEEARYIDTVFEADGRLVWHVFETTPGR